MFTHSICSNSQNYVGFYRHVTKAAKKQLDSLWHTTNIYYHPTIHEYAELMASKLPGNLKVEIIVFIQSVHVYLNKTTPYIMICILQAGKCTSSFGITSL